MRVRISILVDEVWIGLKKKKGALMMKFRIQTHEAMY